MFIGARIHSCIAALSIGIPTLSLAYGHKYKGIIGQMMDQEKYILNVENLNWEILKSKIDEIWNHKKEIRKGLKVTNKELYKKSEQNFEILKSFFQSLKIKTRIP